MDIENEIIMIKQRLNSLQQSFLQAQKNQIPFTEKTDEHTESITELDERADGTDESITGLEDMILEMSEIIYA